ncbi:hypothetical protein [Limosilactobacillus caecicola]|uniref:hypothetical protein n=1 Tax=Limosilactobacillus caecicola TaxID=2941332 RepID=UPI002040CF0C|nr:hypothetical protein [Limosilactobacillus caecicola]
MIIKRKLADGRVITYQGRRGELMRRDGWHDENVNNITYGERCMPFEDGAWVHAYNDDGKRVCW